MVMPDAFHLGWMGSTRRLFHIAETLKVMGFEVALIAGAMTNPNIQVEVDDAFPGRVIRLKHTGDYPFLLDNSNILRRFWRIFWKFRGDNFYWSKLSWGWADKINIQGLYKQIMTMGSAPSLVWGIGAGYLEGGVAARRIANMLDLPWVFELHDPPRRSGLGPEILAVRKCFTELLCDASKVVVITPSYGDALVDEYPAISGKVKPVHQCYEGEISLGSNMHACESNMFNVVYAGALNGGRTLKPFLTALSGSFKECPEMRETVRIEIAGTGPGFEEIKTLSLEMSLVDSIISHGLIHGDRVAEVIERAAVVIVVQDHSCFYQVPGKVFEIIKIGKPVLGLMPKNCEAADVLVKSGCGVVHEMNDVESIQKTLISMWGLWRAKKTLIKPDLNFIQEFSTEKLPSKLADVLIDVVNFF